jgi:hypothetical protein
MEIHSFVGSTVLTTLALFAAEQSQEEAALSTLNPTVALAGRIVEQDGISRAPYTVVLVADRMLPDGAWTGELRTNSEGRFTFDVPRDRLAPGPAPLVG